MWTVGEKRQHCCGQWLESGNCSDPDGQPRVPFGKCFHSEPLQGLPVYRAVNGRIWLESPGTVKQSPRDKTPHKKINTTSFVEDRSLWKVTLCTYHE